MIINHKKSKGIRKIVVHCFFVIKNTIFDIKYSIIHKIETNIQIGHILSVYGIDVSSVRGLIQKILFVAFQ